MQLLKIALLFIGCCLIMTSCVRDGLQQSPQSRIEVGMNRATVLAILNDANKHYECPGYYEGMMNDFFLYGTTNLEDATIVYVKSKMISDTLRVYDFGIAENYLLPPSYGYCLGLPNSDKSP
jgi:hypothetical protein